MKKLMSIGPVCFMSPNEYGGLPQKAANVHSLLGEIHVKYYLILQLSVRIKMKNIPVPLFKV